MCLIWGTTYLAIKVALEGIPPFLIGGIRYVAAGGTLLLWVVWRGEGLPPRALWWPLAVSGGLLLGVGNGGVLIAEQWVPSGVAAVVIATTPFWMIGIEAMRGQGQVTSQVVAGLLVGFGGVLILVWPDLWRIADADWHFAAGLLALQLACAGWALGSSLSRRFPQKGLPLQTSALQMLFGGLWMLGAGTALGEWHVATFDARSLGAVVYLAYVGGLAGFVAYIYALSRLPLSFVSLYAYANPIIAIALGTLVLGEAFDRRMLVAIVFVLVGMALVTSARQAAASDTDGS